MLGRMMSRLPYNYNASLKHVLMRTTLAKGALDVRETITVITVSDLAKSREWYSRLFGKGPDLEPFPGNVEFKVGDAWVQIVSGKVQRSSWSLQLEVRDLSRERERLRDGGLQRPKS